MALTEQVETKLNAIAAALTPEAICDLPVLLVQGRELLAAKRKELDANADAVAKTALREQVRPILDRIPDLIDQRQVTCLSDIAALFTE